MLKNIVIVPIFIIILALTGCEAPKDRAALEAAQDEAIASIKASLEAKDSEQDKAVERVEAMTEQNRSALRALNDKIDRMFRTISRK
tara:strand:+ start:101 stop:361 length:261 start_codon:yes stop_codon:yes gene_type:complete